jgi:hypothetical protein
VLLLHHCVLATCCGGVGVGVGGTDTERTCRRQHHQRQQQEAEEDEEVSVATSLLASAPGAAGQRRLWLAPVCRYRKEEKWSEPTCAA